MQKALQRTITETFLLGAYIMFQFEYKSYNLEASFLNYKPAYITVVENSPVFRNMKQKYWIDENESAIHAIYPS